MICGTSGGPPSRLALDERNRHGLMECAVPAERGRLRRTRSVLKDSHTLLALLQDDNFGKEHECNERIVLSRAQFDVLVHDIGRGERYQLADDGRRANGIPMVGGVHGEVQTAVDSDRILIGYTNVRPRLLVIIREPAHGHEDQQMDRGGSDGYRPLDDLLSHRPFQFVGTFQAILPPGA